MVTSSKFKYLEFNFYDFWNVIVKIFNNNIVSNNILNNDDNKCTFFVRHFKDKL